MKAGLTSITFRNLDILQLAALAKKSHLSTIEWGGDIHCPPGDTEKTQKARAATEEYGLTVSSYGSYFRLSVNDNSEFDSVCATAQALGASIVRIWAYNKDHDDISCDEYAKVISDARKISDIAKNYGITVCFEYHRGTLTRSGSFAKKLIEDIDRDNIRLYWQPNPEISHSDNCRELETILPYLVNIHCFAWTWEDSKNVRHPLSFAKNEWNNYISIAKKGNVQNILIEFVDKDSQDQLISDGAFLLNIIG